MTRVEYMDEKQLERLRQLGLTRKGASGEERVRAAVQNPIALRGRTLDQRREALEEWSRSVDQRLAPAGASIVPGTLSVLGQTVEVEVPVDAYEAVSNTVNERGERIDLVVPVQAVTRADRS